MDETLCDLIERISGREEEALRLLHARLSGEVFAIAFLRTGDPDAAEDVRQETFLKVWTRAGTFHGAAGADATARAWVLSIARNLALDAGRRRAWEAPRSELVGRCPGRTAFDAEALCGTLDLRALMETLPDRLRGPVVLHVLAGFSLGQCAAHLRVSVPTVSRRCRTGLGLLRERLEREGRGRP